MPAGTQRWHKAMSVHRMLAPQCLPKELTCKPSAFAVQSM